MAASIFDAAREIGSLRSNQKVVLLYSQWRPEAHQLRFQLFDVFLFPINLKP